MPTSLKNSYMIRLEPRYLIADSGKLYHVMDISLRRDEIGGGFSPHTMCGLVTERAKKYKKPQSTNKKPNDARMCKACIVSLEKSREWHQEYGRRLDTLLGALEGAVIVRRVPKESPEDLQKQKFSRLRKDILNAVDRALK